MLLFSLEVQLYFRRFYVDQKPKEAEKKTSWCEIGMVRGLKTLS